MLVRIRRCVTLMALGCACASTPHSASTTATATPPSSASTAAVTQPTDPAAAQKVEAPVAASAPEPPAVAADVTAEPIPPISESQTPLPAFEIERMYPPGGQPRPRGLVAASTFDAELARWNVGGSSAPDHPSNQPKYHPAPRVVVDLARESGGRRDTFTQGVLADARNSGYFPFRTCYEQALRQRPQLAGKTRLRLRLAATGRVTQARVIRSDLKHPDFNACLGRAARSLKFRRAPARARDYDFNIELWPGDAPLPSRSDVASRFDLSAFERVIAARADELAACCAAATRADSRLWGRIALTLQLTEAGSVSAVNERESRFPDPRASACMRQVLSSVTGLPAGKALELTWAARCGEPPALSPGPPAQPPAAPADGEDVAPPVSLGAPPLAPPAPAS